MILLSRATRIPAYMNLLNECLFYIHLLTHESHCGFVAMGREKTNQVTEIHWSINIGVMFVE